MQGDPSTFMKIRARIDGQTNRSRKHFLTMLDNVKNMVNCSETKVKFLKALYFALKNN